MAHVYMPSSCFQMYVNFTLNGISLSLANAFTMNGKFSTPHAQRRSCL